MTPDKKSPQPMGPSFEKGIKLDKPLTIEEAIQIFMTFHKASRESVLDAFFNLNQFVQGGNEGTVVFHEGALPSSLVMRFSRNGKEETSYCLVNKYTGQPMQHIH